MDLIFFKFVTMNFLLKINSTITEENASNSVLPLPVCSFCLIFLIMMTPNKYLDYEMLNIKKSECRICLLILKTKSSNK